MSEQKTIVVGLSGGIATYKTPELVRLYQKAGYKVKVMMTQASTQFISPLTFEALTHETVYTSLFTSQETFQNPSQHPIQQATFNPIPHITLADEADLMVVAPATANIIAKLAHGIADEIVSTTCLAAHCPLIIAPAMNVHMYNSQATQANLEILKKRGVEIVEPKSSMLACGYEGKGALADVEAIFATSLSALTKKDLKGRRILITAGPTQEAIDPVRFIGNRSSGKMGIALAKQALERGAEVDLVCGPIANNLIYQVNYYRGLTLTRVVSAQDMYDACMKLAPSVDIIICAAAVADYRVKGVSPTKLKKGRANLDTLHMEENPDILASLGKRFSETKLVVGFAAETEDLISNAQAKLQKKNAHFIVANDVSQAYSTFGSDTNKVALITQDRVIETEVGSKTQIAETIFNLIAESKLRE